MTIRHVPTTASNAKAKATHSGDGGPPEQRRQPPGDGERTSSIHEGERHLREEGQESTGWKRTQEQEPTHPRRIPDKRKRKAGEQRRSGWATLNEQGLEEVELRDTPDFGGDGHRGVFVREGYVLEKNYRLPYFGRTVADDANQHGNNVFLSALPGRKDCVLNGDPEALARERPDLAPGTWAGAYINHARSRDEENCQMVMLPNRSRRIATELYQGATPEPVKVCFQVTKSVRGGQQLLAAYGWPEAKQREHQCGYAYFAAPATGGQEVTTGSSANDVEGAEGRPSLMDASSSDAGGNAAVWTIRGRPIVGHLRPPRLRPERSSSSPEETSSGGKRPGEGMEE
jgi:hypothetical protein